MSAPPIPLFWDGAAFRPVSGFWAGVAKKHFAEGEVHSFEVREERSRASHNHYHAALQSAWSNLPEALLAEYPSPQHLRKKALIRCGFANETAITCASKAEALRAAVAIRNLDDYAIADVRDAVVRVYVAKSQSMKAMDKKQFAASKDAVLAFVAQLIGSTVEALSKHTSEAA